MQEGTIHPIEALKLSFQKVEDFRKPQGKEFDLHELIAASILSVLCGADDFVVMSGFCKEKSGFLSDYFSFPRPPSHDLFRRVYAHIKPEEFYHFFVEWTGVFSRLFPGQVVAIDGKALRATRENGKACSAIYIVSAWASQNGLALGQVKADKKSNEKTAIPKLLKLLNLTNCIVTIDAMGAHPPIAQNILDQDGDYLLSLKKNNKTFFLEVESFFENFKGEKTIMHDFAEEKVEAHGRLEYRKCYTLTALEYLPDAVLWPKLNCLVCIESQRTIKGKTTMENRYYVSSLEPDATKVLQATKNHWGIENNLHWRLDVTFNEDKCRTKFQNCPENLAAARKIALAVLDADTSRIGGKNKRLKAAWNNNYLIKLLRSFAESIKNK